jgi:antitoxin (DNA-binding transcriptional repressor) of toxin-antitoxin stability system
VAKLVPFNQLPKKRFLGSAKGEFTVPDDFNDPLPKEIEDLFWE